MLVTLDANRYTQCADLFLTNHQEKSERLRKISKLFDVVKGYVGDAFDASSHVKKKHLSQRNTGMCRTNGAKQLYRTNGENQ